MATRLIQIICLLALFAGIIVALNGLSRDAPPTLAVRSQVDVGTILAAREPYRESPFILDHLFDGDETITLYEGDAASQSLRGDAERSYRIYVNGPATLAVTTVLKHGDRTPRIALYNDKNQLIDGGDPVRREGGYAERFSVDLAGLYRVLVRFSYDDVDRIALSARVGKPMKSYAEYVSRRLKRLELEFLPTQWSRLDELRRARRDAEPIEGVRWQPLYQSGERVQARIRSENGPWALATIGLAGRNHAHHSSGLLPSMDVRVVSGALPYGLQRFKLYGLPSKGRGRDMVFESVLRDYGVLMPRADILNVSVDGESQYMELLDGMKPFLFEYAQRNEGAIVGFDADVLIGEANSRFVQKDFYKKAYRFDAGRYGSIASAPFAAAIDENAMALVHAYALSYGGKHGLGQADLRFHMNSRTNRNAPMVRDFNSTIAGDSYFDPVNAFRNTLVELADYAPEWRPNVVTHGSFFIERTESNTELDEFFWWNTHPASLQFFTDPERFDVLARHMALLQAPLAIEQVKNRQENIQSVAEIFEDERLAKELSAGPAQLRFRDFAEAGVAFELGETLTDESRYLRDMIVAVNDDDVVPSESSLQQLAWRNQSVLRMQAHAAKNASGDAAAWHEKSDAPDSVITYLYGTETPNQTQLTFVQRNPRDDGAFTLVNEMNQVFHPLRELDIGAQAFPLTYGDLYLSRIRTDERLRAYAFSIPKDTEFHNLTARVTGGLRYLGPRNISINPAYPFAERATGPTTSSSVFDVSGNVYQLRDDAPVIDVGLEIPANAVLRIDDDRTMQFGETGYLLVHGTIVVDENATLTMTSAEESWMGIHFHRNPDLALRNIVVRNVGNGSDLVDCDGRTYTGGVSFFDTRVQLKNVRVENARVEDALHFLRCDVAIDGLVVQDAMSDAIDADFCVVRILDAAIRYAGGDGVDVSGSLLHVDGARIQSNADKNISAGENSVLDIRHAQLSDATYGVAVKDGSRVVINDSTIERNRYGISSYTKKPVFGEPNVSFGDGVRIRNNRHNIVPYEPAIVQP